MTLFVGISALVIGFAGGWVCYSKFGAKVQKVGVDIAADLKK